MNQKGFVNIISIVVVVAIVAVGGYFAFVKYGSEKSYGTYAECIEKTNLPCKHYYVGDFGQEWQPSLSRSKEECESVNRPVGSTCVLPPGNFRENRWINSVDLARAQRETEPEPQIVNSWSTPTTTDQSKNWKTVVNYIGQLKYPSNYIYHDTSDGLEFSGSFLPNSGSVGYYAIEIPKLEFSNTNLKQAYIVFSATDKINGEKECQQYDYQKPTTMTKQLKTSNITFYMDEHAGVAAGTVSYGNVYRIFYKGVCYELNTWIFYSEISPDYGNTNLPRFDAQKLHTDLISILSTFKFIN